MLSDLIKLLKPYDVGDLLAKVAALQICPENADKKTRLDALAHAISTIPFEEGKARISRQKLLQICNNPPLAQSYIQSQEDPAEQPFTEAYTFIGGSYIVFPGDVTDATFIIRHLNKAILLTTDSSLDENFIQQVKKTNGAILNMSNEVARRAGIRRNLLPKVSRSQDIFVPKNLEQLQSAVTFSLEEIIQLLDSIGIESSTLDPFILDVGTIAPDDYTIEAGPLNARPLVRVKNSLIVSQPGMLLASLRHQILVLAVELGLTEKLANLYKEAVWHTVKESLAYFRCRPVSIPLPSVPDNLPIQDGIWSLDTDKALYVSLSYDDLSDYQNEDVFGAAQKRDNLSGLIEQRQMAVEDAVFLHSQGLNELCVLYLFVGVGRNALFGFNAPPFPLKSPRAVMSVSDFEIISLLEANDPLTILKYAKASDAVREITKVFAWSTLDEFTIYRDNKYSYYLSDDTRPNLITVTPGSGSKLRYEALQRFDFHSALHFLPNYIVEVASLHGNSSIPIYIPRGDIGKRVELLVEGLPVLIWIVGPKESEKIQKLELKHIYAEFADMLGYWLWQLTPSLAQYLSVLPNVQINVLIIRLDLVLGSGWSHAVDPNELPEDPSIEHKLHPNLAEITLIFSPKINNVLASADNRGEQIILEKMLEAISEFLAAKGFFAQANLLKKNIESIVSKHAPLGMKKKLNILDANSNPQLDPNNIPAFRKIQDFDRSNFLDDLGVYLRQELHLSDGSILDKNRTKVLGEVVGFFYQQLQKLVATLNPRFLLEYLVSQNEAIVHERASRLITIPTQLACFEAEQGLMEQLNRQIPEINEAALSSRFLIEYVVARPPNGLRPMSLSLYDELLALASEIVGWAYNSDLIQYSIVDISLSILRSGRLGASRQVLQKAHQRFIPIKSREAISWAHRAFERNWSAKPLNEKNNPPLRVVEVDEAFEAEFGLKLTDVTALLTEIGNIGFEHTKAPIKQMKIEELVDKL